MAFCNISLIFLVLTLATPLVSSQPFLQSVTDESQQSVEKKDGLYCDSWRLSAETNNAGPWSSFPSRCLGFVAGYMERKKYASDSDVIAGEALDFAATVPVAGDGKDVWVFDVDETLLSNLPYYRLHGYGSEIFNETSWDKWVDLAKAPALPASLKLYNGLQGLGFGIVLLTGRPEDQRAGTEHNLFLSGYRSWERLILRGPMDRGVNAVVYKSGKRAELVAQGYRIHGSSGDQWSDLLGSPMATRSFKLPNPMYYIA